MSLFLSNSNQFKTDLFDQYTKNLFNSVTESNDNEDELYTPKISEARSSSSV